ncbi:malonyl-CoA/methylmalonyl-CoA synthetase [Tepidimonas ignava]|uniref:Long-chain-fatty-acid--CoA ligase n=1 Tax=Tepidimonas ignava TaxID=114249 RepID=A0A4R3LBV3_9BURK|nr:malonyl-CoA synthase [Tepidimonas ignava]TCS97232.1 malonyl-CoA/methylmalonyl-CoA synthetase [Tepidimonas ignava]TSE21218.1 Long-chain-fatty-acid--CoA ligase [Tepidimonas ignava]
MSEAEVTNLYAALRAAFPTDLDRTAIETDTGLHYTWRDLERGSAMIAQELLGRGLQPGERVVAQVDKSVEALMLYLAVLRAGLVYVPLNTAYPDAEVEYFVRDAEPAAVVCVPERFGRLSAMAFAAGARLVYTLGADRSGTLLQRAAHRPDQHDPAPVGLNALASIIYTSGTTGRSKGAMLTHGNLLANARVLHSYWGWQPNDVLIHVLPMFHVHGLFVAVHGALLSGSPMLWAAKFDPATVLRWLPRATVFMGVPTLYTRLLAEPELTAQRCASMRLFISGSAPLLIDTFTQWQQRTGHTILERYGMSETIMLTSNPYRPDPRFGHQDERRGGTVGFPLPGVEVRIADAHDRPLPVGEVGGVQVRGPSVFAGYWRMPDKTRAEFTADGWFRTGDVGLFDTRGYLTLVGRSKDLIISGGYNVYPAEVEGAINELPGVAESAVVGVPHPDFGEVGVALVVPRPGAPLDPDAILTALRQRLANYKIPKRCAIVPDLPRNAMGKVQKNVLRQQWRDTFIAQPGG